MTFSFKYSHFTEGKVMAVCDSIREEFSDLGIEVEDDLVLSELAILTARYNIDPEKISCEYFSFNAKHKLGVKPPTLVHLSQFENEKLKSLKPAGQRRPLDPIEVQVPVMFLQ